MSKPSLTRSLSGLLLAAIAGLLTVGCLFWRLQIEVYRDYEGPRSEAPILLIEKGQTITEIAGSLEKAGVIRSSYWFLWYLRIWFRDFSPKAGEYRFEMPLRPMDVAEKLQAGRIHQYRVTIPEGLNKHETIERLSAEGFGSRPRLEELANTPALIADLDPEAWDLEGYLYPDTYLFGRTAAEGQIIGAMVDNLRRIWNASRRDRARELGFTLRQVLSLASLIEKETARSGERRLVSAVFHNRLENGMKLECDPTVIYAVQRVKPYDGVIHQSDLRLDSPYNTYLYPGLPPGPIANPGLASIDAALHPADVNYLFFVSRNDGSHIFSSSYRDHSRAVREYQRNGGRPGE